MKWKTTLGWLAVAAVLFGFLFYVEPRLRPRHGPANVLPGFNPQTVTSVQILPNGLPEIRAVRTNGVWRLTQPVNYPARARAIDGLLATLTELMPVTRITAQDLKKVRHADRAYGFEPPQTTLVFKEGPDDEQQTLIHIGHRTAFGNQVFLQVVGREDVCVVDADLLKLIPSRADDWRERRLAELKRLAFDSVTVNNAGKSFELRRDPATGLWHILLPGWQTRADSSKVQSALRQLEQLRVEQFVSDSPRADLDAFGLQSPELSLTLAQGTNTALRLEFGKTATNAPGQLYARRADQSAVVTVSNAWVEPWRAPYETFRDRHLVALTAPLDAVRVQAEDDFTLRRDGPNTWRIEPGNLVADPLFTGRFITNLCNLQVAEFVKDVVTPPDLPAKGLASPARRYILETTVTNAAGSLTNRVITELDFGTNQNDLVFARRADENSLYAVKLADFERLPAASWQLRDRHIWNFTPTDVARITIHQDGKVREIVRTPKNGWALAPGSLGVINDLALGEVMREFGRMNAAAWVERGDAHRADYGFTTNRFAVSVQLKNGRRYSVAFGGTAPSGFPYATTTIDGQPWIFEFPWATYQYVQLYLTIPDYVP